MRPGDNLVKTFANCFRLLAKLNAGLRDGFFVDMLAGESEKLLAEYVKFLKITGEALDKLELHLVMKKTG